MVQQLLVSVAGVSGLSVIKFLCKGPLKKLVEKNVGRVAKESFFICVYWFQPVLQHLGTPRDIYRGCTINPIY